MRLLRTGLRLESYGADELGAGPVLLVANHSTALDADIVAAALPRELTRRLGRAGTPAQLAAGLRRGQVVLVFPEGRARADGELGAFDPGPFTTALEVGRTAVVPVAIRGAYAALAPGQRWPAPGRPRVAVRFGRPLSGESAVAVADGARAAIAGLLAEDATSWWQVQRSGPATADPTPVPRAAWRRIWEQTRTPTVGHRPQPRGIWGS